jgi:hypothetical protein
MRAIVSSFNLSSNNWHARTDNDIALSFSILDGSRLQLNEELDVMLPTLLLTQTLLRRTTGSLVSIRLRANDMHDLRLPSGHGISRSPNEARLSDA